jgi:hypothetical protein
VSAAVPAAVLALATRCCGGGAAQRTELEQAAPAEIAAPVAVAVKPACCGG